MRRCRWLSWIAPAAALFLLASRAAPQGAPQPNFVVILTDEQRFDTLFAMPIVQQELVSRGVLFSEALVTTPLCCPVRASFLAGGFLAHRTGVVENGPPNGGAPGFLDGDTIATRLQQAGYSTALFGKYLNQYTLIAPYIPPGWMTFHGALQSTLNPSYQVAIGSSGVSPSIGTIVTRTQYGTDYLRDQALAFIDAHAAEPFFVLLSVDAPHVPANPAPQDATLFSDYLFRERAYAEADVSDKPLRVQVLRAQFPALAAAEDLFHRYQLRTLQAVDRAVGAIVTRLLQLGLLDETVIVFASDNGYLWGEHGLVSKGEVYEESIRVPFVAVAPGVAPAVDDHLVAMNLDLAATILEMAGLPSMGGDGSSLVPLLTETNPPWRGSLPIQSWNPTESWAGLRIDDARGRWKYVEHTRGARELYDLAADPFELVNLASQPSQAAFVAQLSAELAPQKGLASTTHSAPTGRVGAPYFRALSAWGGRPPYTWSLLQGPLPPGLALSAAGSIGGTPTAAGAWSVVVEVADTSSDTLSGGAQRYRQPLQITVQGECSDGLDNDGDGFADFAGGDPGCESATDPSERSPFLVCDDGVDNDGDGRIDFAGGDPGCLSPAWSPENPACNDGIDNDGDGGIDFDGEPPDLHCAGRPWALWEVRYCGLGFEVAPILALLAWVGARRRRAGRRLATRALTIVALAGCGMGSTSAGAAPRFLFAFGQPRPNTPTTFGWISGIAVDPGTGDVFVPSGSAIRRFDAGGIYLLGFGNCPGCLGIEVDPATHDVYAADSSGARILQYTSQGQIVRQWGSPGAGNGQFAVVYDVAVDPGRGELYVIDGTRIQVFDRQGTFLRSWGSVGSGWGQFSGGNAPYGVAFDAGTDTVWASDAIHDRIQAFDRFGTFLRGWSDNGGGTGPGQLRWVRNIEVDAAGNVFECDSDNDRIQVFDPSGAFLTQFRGPHDFENGTFHPRAIAVNRTTGETWVAASYAQRVDKFDAANTHLFSFGNREQDGPILWSPLSIAVSQTTGDVFVNDTNHYLQKRFTGSGAFLNEWGGHIGLDPRSDGAYGYDIDYLFPRAQTPLATDAQGDLWVGGYPNHYLGDPHYSFLRRFDPSGIWLLGWKPNLLPTQQYQETAAGLAIDPVDGRAYVSDALIDRVRVHGANGSVLFTVSVPGPSGIAATPDGFYVAAARSQTLRKYDRAGILQREWGGPGAGEGQLSLVVGSGIALDSAGRVYVADTGKDRVQVFDATGRFLEAFGSSGRTPGQFRFPYGVAVYRATQTLYVLDTVNDRVQAFALEGSPPCVDGIDNDGDGLVDFAGGDPGCFDPAWVSENPACSDGIDNDGDGGIDFDGSPPDLQCGGKAWSLWEIRACGLGFETAPLLVLATCLRAARRRRAASREDRVHSPAL